MRAADQHGGNELPDDRTGSIGETEGTRVISRSRPLQLTAAGLIKATKSSYQRHRRFLDTLVVTMADVVAEQLPRLLRIERPW